MGIAKNADLMHEKPSVLDRRLVEAAYEAMRAGIQQVRPGATGAYAPI